VSSGSLPALVVIGAMKSGTTSLHHYLGAHPDLFVPLVKEVNFFVEEHNWHRGVDWYRAQYQAAGGRRGVDVSPDYSKHPHYAGVPERMAATIPDAVIGYVVRDPVDRIASMYRHQLAMRREHRSIDEAVLADRHYVETSSYAMQLDRYTEHFDRSQIHVLSAEALRRDPVATTSVLTAALGLDPLDAVPAGEWNRSDEKGQRRAFTRLLLSMPYSRQIMAALPEPVRRRVRRAGHRPIDPAAAQMSPATAAELRRRLADEVSALEEDWIPGVGRDWGFSDGATAVSRPR
jgi:PAS domain-containing protein